MLIAFDRSYGRLQRLHFQYAEICMAQGLESLPTPQVFYTLPATLRADLVHGDADFFRDHRWLVRDMILIPQQQLQGVFPCGQIDDGFGLTTAKMSVVLIGWHGLVKRRQHFHIHQQMVVTCAPAPSR